MHSRHAYPRKTFTSIYTLNASCEKAGARNTNVLGKCIHDEKRLVGGESTIRRADDARE